MRLSLVMFLTMAYIVGMLISNTCEQQTVLGTAQNTTVSGLLSPPISDFSNPFAGAGSLISISLYYVGLFFKIATFDFAIFYGTWSVLRWVFCAIGVGMMVGWITILRGVNSN